MEHTMLGMLRSQSVNSSNCLKTLHEKDDTHEPVQMSNCTPYRPCSSITCGFVHPCVRSESLPLGTFRLATLWLNESVGWYFRVHLFTYRTGGGEGTLCWDYFAVVNFAAGNFAEVAENGVGNSIAYKQGTSKREGAQSATAALSHKVIQKHTTPVQTTKYQRG